MVKKLGTLGLILVAICVASMAWAGTHTPAPQPVAIPAGGQVCAPGQGAAPGAPTPDKLTTTIKVHMQYPQPVRPAIPSGYGCGPGSTRPPIPVAVPMWKFIVPWPPFVYYLPVK
jgi:hypothetical protein